MGDREIAEGVRVLQSALTLERPGRYQLEAAIAALHDDAATSMPPPGRRPKRDGDERAVPTGTSGDP